MTRTPDAPRIPARVLVVDDERRNRDLIAVILEAEGYVVLTAASGDDALEKATLQLPDLILLDVMMPGMDGYQVVAKIKAGPPTSDIPVILLTALDDSNSRAHGIRAGADGYLTKPVNPAELCARVRSLLPRG